ncbi:MAG: DUF3313 domain-containing protein [Luteibacter sp.]
MRLHVPLTASLALSAALLTGCSHPTKPVAYQDIESSAYLRPNEAAKGPHSLYTYDSNVDWHAYHSFMMDPVAVYRGADAQFVKVSEAEKGELAIYTDNQFVDRLKQHFEMVSLPRPDTLRIRVTLTGAQRTTAFLSTFTKMDMGGMPINSVKSMTGGEGLFMGSVSYAVEVFDASNGKLLRAYVDKQYPNAMNFKASFGPLTASKRGIDKGADSFVSSLGR